MVELTQGANAPVTDGSVVVAIDWPARVTVEADVSAYLLTDAGRVRGDGDMLFFNNPVGGEGAVRFAASGTARGRFEIDLARMPPAITRIVFCLTIDEAAAGKPTLAALAGARITAGDHGYAPALGSATEAAMILGEVYLRGGAWKFRAVGQGFDGGLAPLARSFGIDVAEEVPAPVAPPSPPAAKPISLNKVTLAKQGSIRLDKRTGAITATLRWAGRDDDGDGDLDLYCYYVLHDGTRGKVYYRNLGNSATAPNITLSGDSQDAGQETIVIHRPDRLRYALFAAYSAVGNGAGSFESYRPEMTFSDRSGNEVKIPLLSPVATSYWVAISHISFEDATIISHVEKYGKSHSEQSPRLHSDGTWDVSKGEIEFKDDDE